VADLQFVRIRSWHVVRLWSDRVGRTWTVCGRSIQNADIVDTLPAGKSCETCLRISARAADVQPEPENAEVPI
jgi:hypothetical protein